MFKHLLVPTDGSNLSSEIVVKSVEFAREINARITFLYAIPDYTHELFGESAVALGSDPARFEELAEQRADSILSSCEKISAASGVASVKNRDREFCSV